MKILLVEDDQSLAELLTATLTAHRYTVDVATDGQTGLELATLWNYDLILLDVQIPKLDGISVCRQLRSQTCTVPILVLTAHDSSDHMIQALDAGADDYVTKPCDPVQLLARIRALSRRGGISLTTTVLTWGHLCLNPASAQVTYKRQDIPLTPKEYRLLELFLRHPHQIFSRSAIVDHIWSIDNCPTEKAVTNLIKDLRRKLKAGGMPEELIATVYGLGYRLMPKPPEETRTASDSLPSPPGGPPNQPDQPSASGTWLKNPVASAIVERFKISLNQRVAVLEEALQALQTSSLTADHREKAREEAHRLAGGLGTFGYEEGSILARAIEQQLADAEGSGAEQLAQLSPLLGQLKQAILQSPSPPPAASSSPDSLAATTGMLVIDPDSTFTQALQAESIHSDFQLTIAPDGSTALQLSAELAPNIILLNLDLVTHALTNLLPWQTLKAKYPNARILAIAEQDSLEARVTAVKIGSDRYLSKPVLPREVLEVARQYLPPLKPLNAKVMVVDDDPIALALLAHLLQPWGMQVTCLSNPQQFWNVLTATHPDLLLLDVEMPNFSGIELCQVVRQDGKYSDLPILVVTSHTDRQSIDQVFAAGADDLIAKPVAGPELVTRVLSRIERSRLRQQVEQIRQRQAQLWQQQASIDGITQVLNRRTCDEFLQQVWLQQIASGDPLAIILCDVDYFKLYNDSYGHPAGDHCLKQIASVLRDCIKPSTDRVARYGGEEFMVVLPQTHLNGALQVAERIQQAIAHLHIPHPASTVCAHITLSMGITGTNPTGDKSIAELIAIADKALYAAKKNGRNTYCLYPY